MEALRSGERIYVSSDALPFLFLFLAARRVASSSAAPILTGRLPVSRCDINYNNDDRCCAPAEWKRAKQQNCRADVARTVAFLLFPVVGVVVVAELCLR